MLALSLIVVLNKISGGSSTRLRKIDCTLSNTFERNRSGTLALQRILTMLRTQHKAAVDVLGPHRYSHG